MKQMVAIINGMANVIKDAKAQFVKDGRVVKEYNYATLDTILDAVRPLCASNGVALYHTVWSVPCEEGIKLTVSLNVSDGDTKEELASMATTLPNTGNIAQECGKIITYFRRYELMSCLGIAGEDDDDASGLNIQPKSKKPDQPKPAAASQPSATPQPEQKTQADQVNEKHEPGQKPEEDGGNIEDDVTREIMASKLTDAQKNGMVSTYRSLTGESRKKFAEVALTKVRAAK